MSLIISRTRLPKLTTANGREGILWIGDSILAGSSTAYGPTPTAGTVYQVNLITRAVTQIGATDISDSVGYTCFSMAPSFGIHYNTATGRKPMIMNHAISGSTFEEWDTVYLDSVIPNANLFLSEQGLGGFRAIVISLGINDRDDPSLPGVQTYCNSVYTKILSAFPKTKIYVVQAALSNGMNDGVMFIKKMLKQKVRDNRLVRFAFNYQGIHASNYFYDANHANATGNDEMGKMLSRAIIHENEPKEAASIMSSRFDDADITERNKIKAFTTAMGDSFYDIDFLTIGKQPDSRSKFTDFGLLHAMSNFGSYTADAGASYSTNNTSHVKTGIVPSITLMKATVSDMFVMIDYLSSQGTADATAAVFGCDDGTRSFTLKEIGASTEIRGRANTTSGDEVLEGTDNFIAGNSYGLKVNGTSLQIIKNGSNYGSAHTITGAQTLATQQIMAGGMVTSGVVGNMRPLSFRWMVMGKASTVNLATLNSALNTLVS